MRLRVGLWLMLAFAVTGCGNGAPPSQSPSRGPDATSIASASPPRPSASASPSPSPEAFWTVWEDRGGRIVDAILKVGTGYLAVGGDATGAKPALWRSSDGRAWKPVPDSAVPASPDLAAGTKPTSRPAWSAAAAGDIVMVVRDDGLAWRSADGGANWSALDSRKAGLYGHQPAGPRRVLVPKSIGGLSGDGHGFLAIGHACYCAPYESGDMSAIVWTSTDGTAWHATALSAATLGSNMEEPVAAWRTADGYVAVGNAMGKGGGSDVTVWRSRDGKAWTRSSEKEPGDQSIYGAGIVAGKLIIAGHDASEKPRIATSIDRVTWHDATLPSGLKLAYTTGSDGTTAATAALRDDRLVVLTSRDGATWAIAGESSGTAAELDGFRPNAILVDGGIVLVAGTYGTGAAIAIARV